MIDAKFLATATQFTLLGGVFIAAYVWWKSQPPLPEKEEQRGYDDATDFHKRGVNAWAMKGFVDVQRAADRAGPYEMGMLKAVNEILKVNMK